MCELSPSPLPPTVLSWLSCTLAQAVATAWAPPPQTVTICGANCGHRAIGGERHSGAYVLVWTLGGKYYPVKSSKMVWMSSLHYGTIKHIHREGLKIYKGGGSKKFIWKFTFEKRQIIQNFSSLFWEWLNFSEYLTYVLTCVAFHYWVEREKK